MDIERIDDKDTEDTRYLKLDQSTPQTVITNAPHFNAGIIVLAGQKLILDGG